MRQVISPLLLLALVLVTMPAPVIAQRTTEAVFTPPPLPKSVTKAQVQALERTITVNEDGTLEPLEENARVAGQLSLSLEELKTLNDAIEVVNASRQINRVSIENDIFCQEGLGDAGGALYAAGKAGYWWCVSKILKCEVISAGCLASAPACVVGCKAACVGSLGWACVSCVTACTGGAVALCDSALDCWSDARKWGCIP